MASMWINRDRCLAIFTAFIVLIMAGSALAEELTAPAAPCTVNNLALPTVVRVPELFEPSILELLRWSQTFRHQCLRLLSEASRLQVVMSVKWATTPFAGRTTVGRASTGGLRAWIDVSPASRYQVELIAHEIEHVIEYLDGVDVRELASRLKGAHRTGTNLFESDRAIRVGREVAHEMAASRRARANLAGARAAQ